MELKEQLFTVSILLMWYGGRICCTKEHNRNLTSTGSSDFVQEDKFLTRIAFGSCMNGLFTGSDWYKEPQVVWKQIMRHQPDIWMWLGDATYADTRIIPLIWKPSPLQLMAEYFRRQKHHPDYQEFLKSGVTIVGTWDDHDYGMNNGGKHFKNRLQSQDIYLDFIDEPSDSLRRKREGMYVSYTFGHGDKAVKLIMLDVRSFVIYGKGCDLLGNQQWQWLAEQLSDPTHTGLTIITSGIQVLSDGPLLQKWMDCPQSYDRLIWLTQQRDRVIYLSGDVHFGEISCVNSFSSGFPIYDLTSSGLFIACTAPYVSSEVCGWIVRNVIGNDFGIHDPVVERNFGFIDINWDSSPVQIKLQIFGEHSDVASEVIFNLGHIQKQSKAERCVQSNRMKPKFMTILLFWTFIGLLLFAILVIILSLLFLLCKCVFMVLRVLIRFLPFWKSNQVEKKKKS